MHSFTAIDFETAQGYRHTICQVGLVRVEYENNAETDVPVFRIREQISLLVQPPENYYWNQFIDIHGITPQMTANAPTFDQIWSRIIPFIKGQNLVAHNMPFDNSCLIGTLQHYNLAVPEYDRHCTYRLYGTSLDKCCAEHNIKLNHHEALSDALACAELYKKWLGKEMLQNVKK
jgi:DNA polymerase-3 subunit epsilon